MIRSTKYCCRQSGFSLIELLVAVLVIVMLTTVVGLNVGSGGRGIELDDEVRRLASLMGYVQSEAEMSGADHGLYLERSDGFNGTQYAGYWLRRYDQGWSDPRGSAEVLETFTFSEDVEISLALIGDPEVEITDRDPDLNPAPQIVLFAGGEVTEGELDWTDPRSGELLYRLRWDLLGRIEFLPKGEAPDDETLR